MRVSGGTKPALWIKSRRADLSCRSSRVRLFGFTLSALAPVWAPTSSSSRRLPRVLIGQAEYSEIGFSFAFATVALVMIVTTRFAKSFVARWGIAGCVARGMALLVCGAVLLGIGELYGSPSFLTFILPMWVVAVGIVFTVSVTANGALAEFDDIAGSAVAFYFCVQSLIVSIVGTLAVALLNDDTAWPVICYATAMAVLVSLGLVLLRLRGAATEKSPVV